MWWGYHDMMGTLKHYLIQKNFFELFALTGRRNAKTLGDKNIPGGFTMTYLFSISYCYQQNCSNRGVSAIHSVFLHSKLICCFLCYWHYSTEMHMQKQDPNPFLRLQPHAMIHRTEQKRCKYLCKVLFDSIL